MHPQRPTKPRRSPVRESRVGPGSYAPASSIGKQQLSKQKTSERALFGTATRDQQEKTYCSPQHAALQSSTVTKDATWLTSTALGLQASSKKPSAPRCSFGTSSRFGNGKQFISKAHATSQAGMGTPGPIYKLQRKVRRPKTRSGTFGKSTRQNTNTELGTSLLNPGPGAYGANDAIRSRAAPKVGFGSSTRAKQEKVFMPGGSANDYGKGSPGPAHYNPPVFEAKIPPSFTFGGDFIGTGALPSTAAQNPGPGTHALPEGSGKQAESKRRTEPRCAFGKDGRSKKVDRSKDPPGAGQYTMIASTGRQVETARKNMPVFSFGTSQRPPLH
jgi:hypothetical protein